jgi:hypothetical protein
VRHHCTTFPLWRSTRGAIFGIPELYLKRGDLPNEFGPFCGRQRRAYTYELAGFQWDSRGWLLRAIPYTDPELLHPEDLVFPTGINNFRIQYTAGYTTVPEGVQEACAEWVAILYNLTLRDPALTHQLTAGGQASGWDNPTLGKLPSRVQALLRPYRSYTIMTDQS